MPECAKLRLPEQVTTAQVRELVRNVEFHILPDRDTILAVLSKLEQMRGALVMARAVIRRGKNLSTPIAATPGSPTIGEVIDSHFR